MRLRTFLVVGGLFLILWGLYGLVQPGGGRWLSFDRLSWLHLAAGALLLGGAASELGRGLARGVSLLLLALAVVGTLNPGLVGLGRIVGVRVEFVENLVHLAIGAWGARVAFVE